VHASSAKLKKKHTLLATSFQSLKPKTTGGAAEIPFNDQQAMMVRNIPLKPQRLVFCNPNAQACKILLSEIPPLSMN